MKRGTPTGKHFASGSSLEKFPTRSLKVFEGPGKERDVDLFVGAFHALPFGFGEVAVEAGIPRAVSAKVRPAIGQMRRRSGHCLGYFVLLGAEAGRNGPGSLASLGECCCWAEAHSNRQRRDANQPRRFSPVYGTTFVVSPFFSSSRAP